MQETGDELIQHRINNLWEKTDFSSTLFGTLVGYSVIAADFDGNIIAFNEGARQIYGHTPAEVVGNQNIEILFPRDFIEAGYFQQLVDVLLATGRFCYEGEKVRKDGSRFPAQVTFTLTKDKTGMVVGFVEIAQDLTERKRAEEVLRASEERNRLIVDIAHSAFVAMDAGGLITDWNRQAEVTFGWSREEALHRPLAETILPPAYRDGVAEGLRRFLATGEASVFNQRLEMTALHRDGREFPVEMTLSSPIRWEGSYLFSAFVHDISARKRAEEELRQTAADLLRSNQELEQFAYVASHDLKEPLRKIRIYLEMLSQRYRGRLDEQADQFITFAVDSAGRMQSLVNDLLAYARVGSRSKTLEPVDCSAALDQALLNLETTIQETAAEVHVAGPLPRVAGNLTLLVALFQNLIGNAVKFRGDRRAVVHVQAERRKGDWLFSVRDNGIGIDPQYVERIFVIFQRLHSQRDYAGTGIGLAICKKIVELLGGKIWVESQPGTGSTFFFSIPPLKDHPA